MSVYMYIDLTIPPGGYYSGFKRLMDKCENLGFPIAELNADGSCIITKEENGTGGEVSKIWFSHRQGRRD